ncbi:hypothetical protein CVT30_00110 [Streptomyces sp. AMCC400023]|nr:hypothetical protein CVT30_00110 [Streptomyces sp. AMCC400023]
MAADTDFETVVLPPSPAWVRIRLGHRSATTTPLYLQALQELEMHTFREGPPRGPSRRPLAPPGQSRSRLSGLITAGRSG